MKRNSKPYLAVILGSLMLMNYFASTAWADDLMKDNDDDMAPPMAAPMASSPLVRLTHSTNYDTDFSQYSSFMQSPYQNAIPPAPGMAAAPMNTQTQNQMPQDPLGASEVSPYAKYSPYMEIVGEGSNYTLGIDDVVTVIVRDQPDFSGRFIIDPEGNIQYNFVGDVPAVGKTKEQLKAELTERLKKFVRYPEVAVMISEYRSKAVYVFGYVNAPGKYAMKGDEITVKDAVVAAGLPRFDGALKRVYVIRPEKTEPMDMKDAGAQAKKDDPKEKGKEKIEKKKIDLKRMLYKGESADNFLLQPGDTIVINQRYFDKFVNNFTRIIGPVFQAAAVYELAYGEKEDGFLG